MIQTTMYDIKNTIKNPAGQNKFVGGTKQDNVFEQMFVHYKGQGAKGETKAYKRKEKGEEELEEKIDNNYEGKEKKENEESCKEEISDWNLEISRLGVLWNQMAMTEEDMGEQDIVGGEKERAGRFAGSPVQDAYPGGERLVGCGARAVSVRGGHSLHPGHGFQLVLLQREDDCEEREVRRLHPG